MSSYSSPSVPSRVPAHLSWVDRIATDAQDPLLLIARMLLGAIFIWSGFGKLMNLDGFITSLANQGVPMAPVLGIVGPCVEFFGGLAIVLGAWTRPAAILMVVFTACATLIAHRYWEAPEAQRVAQQIQFMKNVAIIGGFVALIAAGPGRFSVDGFRWQRKSG
jgi:putative oxidoreductase